MSTLTPIYNTLDEAADKANQITQLTGRYWTAIRWDEDAWTISDRYHPTAG